MWITCVEEADARGLIDRLYRSLGRSWGGVDHIVKSTSLVPEATRALLNFYKGVMHGDCGISMRQRELIAVTVSSINHCHY